MFGFFALSLFLTIYHSIMMEKQEESIMLSLLKQFRIILCLFLIVALNFSHVFSQTPEMMRTYLLNEIAGAKAQWQERYDTLQSREAITEYKNQRRNFLATQLGRMWNRDSALNPKVTKTHNLGTPGKDAYRVEMVVFESTPGFYVSGAVFIPDATRFKPPYPTVLVVCGHSSNGKAYELYQKVPALAASHGLLAMSIDPIDQGERAQRLNEGGKPASVGVAAHNIIGAGSILLGRNTATFEVWDMIRALDYLQSRPDVIPDKIGVTGTSGGGTQTSYIMSLDDRVQVAVPSCYICGLYDKLTRDPGPQDAEQNIFGQLGFGMDHVDYCIMRAPRPTLIETTTDDFFFVDDAWKSYRNAKRIYNRLGLAEQMAIIEDDGGHGWHKNMREASIRWMLRWLAGRDEQIFEADDMPIINPDDFLATPNGQVMLLDGARSAFDLNRDYNNELRALREAKRKNQDKTRFIETVRKVIGVKTREEIVSIVAEPRENGELSVGLTTKEVESFILKAENGKILLPAICFTPQESHGGVTILLNEKGKMIQPEMIQKLLQKGKNVVAVDLRGLGETQSVGSAYYDHKIFGPDGTIFYLAYLLGKTYVGMRTEDLLAVCKWTMEKYSTEKVELCAMGDTTSLVALHAKTIEPDMFSNLILDRNPRSWDDVVQVGCSYYPITNLVHGALLEYDVPDLMNFCQPEIMP